jgi:hypothetical protein
MVRALQKHVRLLRGHAVQAFDNRNDDYVSEVAATLRILVSEAHSNTPILLRMMRRFGIEVRFDEGVISIPPGADGLEMQGTKIGLHANIEKIAWMSKGLEIGCVRFPPPVRSITLEDYLSSFSHIVGRIEVPPKPVTKIELIQTLANQYGGAHEDEGLSEHLAFTLNSQLRVDARLPHIEVLRGIAWRVGWVADQFLVRLEQRRPDLFASAAERSEPPDGSSES